MLTLEEVQQVYLPINIYNNKAPNLRDASRGIQLNNKSVNLYEALMLFGGGNSATDLGTSVSATDIDITSSTGADITLVSASDTDAGLLTAADYTLLHDALQSVSVGEGITGDGTSGDPLVWTGAFTTGPVTGSGTSFFPINIINNSITTNHIQNGTILFSDWNQNGASNGQVPQWNGTAWTATTLSNLLPSGSQGETLVHNGTSWVAVQRIKETISGINDFFFDIASSPLTYMPIDVYKDGVLQTEVEDYNRVAQQFTMSVPLIPTDRMTVIYYTA